MKNTKNKKNFTFKQLIDYNYEENPLPHRILELLVYKNHYFQNIIIKNCAIVKSR